MPAILPNLAHRLRETLARCGPFYSNDDLRAVFVDTRISEWQLRAPSGRDAETRIQRLIDALHDQYNAQGENALVLFLHVLHDATPPKAKCFTNLEGLIHDLALYLAPGTPDAEGPPPALADYYATLRHRHSQIQLWGQSRPLELEAIFTEVYVLEQPSAFRQVDTRRLRHDPTQLKESERVEALPLLLNENQRALFILGKPGAGKTTLLRYLALQATTDTYDVLPIFIELRAWADSKLELQAHITQEFEYCHFPGAWPYVQQQLETGRAWLLCDALDEVPAPQRPGLVRALQDFRHQYPASRYVITCRTATVDHIFAGFTYIQVADFNDDQVKKFVQRWFADDAQRAQGFLQETHRPAHRGLRELTYTPLLLALLCQSFERGGNLAQRRGDIYTQIFVWLLAKWDKTKPYLIDRHGDSVYGELTVDERERLLAHLAARAFEAEDLYLREATAARQIATYLHEVSGYQRAGRADGSAILQDIESQHGILTQHAQGVYAFAHLTFQEYLTARDIVERAQQGDPTAIPGLLAHITEARWREVILLTASMLDEVDEFFAHFLTSLDTLVCNEPQLVEFLTWTARKTASVTASYKPPAVRAYYFWIALDLALNRGLARAYIRALDRALDRALNRTLNRTLPRDLVLEISLTLDLDPTCDLDFDPTLDLDRRLDRARDLALTLTLDLTLDLDRDHDLARDLALPNDRVLDRDRDLAQEIGATVLHAALTALTLPDEDAPEETWRAFAKQLQTIMIEHRNIGHDWDFTAEQIQTLNDYLTAANLLVECLDVAYVTDRAVIEDRLLLPPAPVA